MTTTNIPGTRTVYPTWWLRHGGTVVLILLPLVWLLPLPSLAHASACGLLLALVLRIHIRQAAYRRTAGSKDGAP